MNNSELFSIWAKELNTRSDQNHTFIENTYELAEAYNNSKKERSDIGFNVFTLASDLYYRENFHSYVVAAFLDPNEKHGQRSVYLHQFIEMLNLSDLGLNISINDFENSEVFIEKHKIDILITDQVSRKAIIIENKVNNAVDQEKQIPRYVNVIKPDYEIVAIVYLTLSSGKTPDRKDWTIKEEKFIDSKLVLLPSFHVDKSNLNLYHNWIEPVIGLTKKSDTKSIIRQYGELIKYLNTNSMDTVSMSSFYETLRDKNNLESAVSIRNMLNDLPIYLAIRIEEKYRTNFFPFSKLDRWKPHSSIFGHCIIKDLKLSLDIWCFEDRYEVIFWETARTDIDLKEFCLNKIHSVSDFKQNENRNTLRKNFDVLDEDSLFKFIDNLIEELKLLKDKQELVTT